MIRMICAALLSASLVPKVAAVLSAQEPPPGPVKEEPGNKQEKPAVPSSNNDELRKLVERLNKNMDSSEERLGKKDAGEDTRKVQADIIKDLDELMKQKSQSGGGGGGGGTSSSSSAGGQSGGASKSTVKHRTRSSRESKGRDDLPKGASQKDASAEQGKELGKPTGNAEQSAKGGLGKGAADGSLGGNSKEQKDKNTIHDLFKDVWGHLPLNKRQEMDAYAKERFLAKYDEILRQYYRSISEQGRRKDGD